METTVEDPPSSAGSLKGSGSEKDFDHHAVNDVVGGANLDAGASAPEVDAARVDVTESSTSPIFRDDYQPGFEAGVAGSAATSAAVASPGPRSHSSPLRPRSSGGDEATNGDASLDQPMLPPALPDYYMRGGDGHIEDYVFYQSMQILPDLAARLSASFRGDASTGSSNRSQLATSSAESEGRARPSDGLRVVIVGNGESSSCPTLHSPPPLDLPLHDEPQLLSDIEELTENGSDLDSPATGGSSGGASSASAPGVVVPGGGLLVGAAGGLFNPAALASLQAYYMPSSPGDEGPVEIVQVMEIPEPHFLSDIEEVTENGSEVSTTTTDPPSTSLPPGPPIPLPPNVPVNAPVNGCQTCGQELSDPLSLSDIEELTENETSSSAHLGTGSGEERRDRQVTRSSVGDVTLEEMESTVLEDDGAVASPAHSGRSGGGGGGTLRRSQLMFFDRQTVGYTAGTAPPPVPPPPVESSPPPGGRHRGEDWERRPSMITYSPQKTPPVADHDRDGAASVGEDSQRYYPASRGKQPRLPSLERAGSDARARSLSDPRSAASAAAAAAAAASEESPPMSSSSSPRRKHSNDDAGKNADSASSPSSSLRATRDNRESSLVTSTEARSSLVASDAGSSLVASDAGSSLVASDAGSSLVASMDAGSSLVAASSSSSSAVEDFLRPTDEDLEGIDLVAQRSPDVGIDGGANFVILSEAETAPPTAPPTASSKNSRLRSVSAPMSPPSSSLAPPRPPSPDALSSASSSAHVFAEVEIIKQADENVDSDEDEVMVASAARARSASPHRGGGGSFSRVNRSHSPGMMETSLAGDVDGRRRSVPAPPVGELTMEQTEEPREKKSVLEGAIAVGTITVYAPKKKAMRAAPEDGAPASLSSTEAPPREEAQSRAPASSEPPTLISVVPAPEEPPGFHPYAKAYGDMVITDAVGDSDRNGAGTSENELTQDSIDSGGTVIDVAPAAAASRGKRSEGGNKPPNLILPEEGAIFGDKVDEREIGFVSPAILSSPISPSFAPASPIPDIVLPRSDTETELGATTADEDRRESESGDASCEGVYDETSDPRSDSYPVELNSRSFGSQVTSGEESSERESDLDRISSRSKHSTSSFDHGNHSGRQSAHSVSSFKHVHRTKEEEDRLWASHMVRGGVSREDLTIENDMADFQERLRENMFTVDQIDFDEPLVDPAEKYYDLLWPKPDDEDSDNRTVSTCIDNPNLQMVCRLKNEDQVVDLTLFNDRLEWVNHSVPSIPNGLKQQITMSAGPLLKIKLQTSSLSAYLMSCMIPLEDVLAARTSLWTTHDKCIAKSDKVFTIYALDKKPNNVWWYCTVHFECDTVVQAKVWAHTISRHIWMMKRPRCLLVFVNPFGGKGNAMFMYNKKIRPLLNLALIKAEVIITKGGHYIEDFLSIFRFDTVDGVLAIGGDGTFSKVCNGLLRRAQADAEVKLNLSPKDMRPGAYVKPPVPVGHIPAGSNNGFAYSVTGCTEPTTALLHVILGRSMGLDVVSVHDAHTGKFLRFSAVGLAYGSAADGAIDADRNRWMGPWRYFLAGAKVVQRHKMYAGRLEFLPAAHSGHTADGNVCYAGCETCAEAAEYCAANPVSLERKERIVDDAAIEDAGEPRWQSCATKFHSIVAVGHTARSRTRLDGDLPFTHLGDGTVELMVISECTRREIVKMARHGGFLSSDTVVPHRVRAFRFTPLDANMEEISRRKERKGGRKEEEEEDEVASSKPSRVLSRAPSRTLSRAPSMPISRPPSGLPSRMPSGLPSGHSLDDPDAALRIAVGVKRDADGAASRKTVSRGSIPESEDGAATNSSSGKGSSSGAAQDGSPVHRPTCFPQFQSTSQKARNKDLSVWTTDGETEFEQKSVVCYVHCQLLNIFGHGIDKQQDV